MSHGLCIGRYSVLLRCLFFIRSVFDFMDCLLLPQSTTGTDWYEYVGGESYSPWAVVAERLSGERRRPQGPNPQIFDTLHWPRAIFILYAF